MSSQVISYRLGTDEVSILKQKALPGESDNQTAQRLMRELLGLSTEASTMSTTAPPSLDERLDERIESAVDNKLSRIESAVDDKLSRIESAVNDKLSSFVVNQNELFTRLQERIQALEAQAIALPPTSQVQDEPDPDSIVDSPVDDVDIVLTAKELAQRLKVHPATLTKNRAKPAFTDWTRGRDPEGKAWQYFPEVERYKPILSTEVSTESTGGDNPSLSGWKARVDEVVNSL